MINCKFVQQPLYKMGKKSTTMSSNNPLSGLSTSIPGIDINNTRPLQSLWAGYGKVLEVHDKQTTYIAKLVQPPAGSGVSHQRKLTSYQVEAAFYTHAAPILLDDAHAGRCPIPTPHHIECSLEDASSDHGSMLLLLSDLRPQYPSRHGQFDLQHAKAVLTWLAEFHATFWLTSPRSTRQQYKVPGVWDQGTYWHLATRQEELQDMERSWAVLKEQADTIDRLLSDPSSPQTLLHGDSKAANFLFNDDNPSTPIAAAYDFQYTGYGDPTKDVAYTLVSSVNSSVLGKHEDELLEHYHSVLSDRLRQSDDGDVSSSSELYTLEYMKDRLELAVADFVRFQAGWGYWGATSWAEKKTRDCLEKLANGGYCFLKRE